MGDFSNIRFEQGYIGKSFIHISLLHTNIIFNKSFKVRFTNDIALEMFGKHQFFLGDKIATKKLQPINKLLKKVKKLSSAELEMSFKQNKEDKYFLLSASKMDSTNEFIVEFIC